MEKSRALFLDRDGVINEDRDYVHTRDEFIFLPGIFSLCRKAVTKGYLIIVATNQSGIERGYYTEEEFLDLTRWMTEQFAQNEIHISKVYYAPSLSGWDRKPNPGMFLQAEKEFQIDMKHSCSLGDKERDILAARAAGVGTNVLFERDFSKTVVNGADLVISTLKEMESLL